MASETVAQQCVATGAGVAKAVPCCPTTFEIEARDAGGNCVGRGGDFFNVFIVSATNKSVRERATVEDLRNGKYEVTYRVNQEGKFLVHVKFGVEYILDSPFTLDSSMANYGDLLGSVSSISDAPKQPSGDEADVNTRRLLDFERQRLEAAQLRLMSLNSDEKNTDLALERLRMQRSALVDELRTLREQVKVHQDAPAQLQRIKAEYAKLHSAMKAVDKERMGLLDNINALTLELNMQMKAHSKTVKNAEDVVVKINAAEYEWRQQYQSCSAEVSHSEASVHELLQKKAELVDNNQKLHTEYDMKREELAKLKDIYSKLSSNASLLQQQTDDLCKEYEEAIRQWGVAARTEYTDSVSKTSA